MKCYSYDEEAYKLHIIKTDRFKNCEMEIIFRDNIDRNTITSKSMLTDLLTYSSLKYPSSREMCIALEELYNSGIYGINSRVGNTLLTTIGFEFLNPKYIKGLTLKDFISFPFEIILNPNVTNNEFDIKSFEVVKNRLESEIKSLKDYVVKYAMVDTLKEMDKDSPISYQVNGYLEDFDSITPSSLIKNYEHLLENEYCDIFVVGNLDPEEVRKIISNSFKIRSIKTQKTLLRVTPKARKKPLYISKKESYSQSNLIVVYNLNDLSKNEETTILPVFNSIFGGDGLNAKLAKNLRQDNSLCYTVSSFPAKYDSLLLIHAGIDAKNYDKSLKLINKALAEIQRGVISDEELDNAKKSIINSLKTLTDNQSSILNNYLFHIIDNLPLYEERIKLVQGVSKEDIVKLANKLQLNTVNLIEGCSNEGV